VQQIIKHASAQEMSRWTGDAFSLTHVVGLQTSTKAIDVNAENALTRACKNASFASLFHVDATRYPADNISCSVVGPAGGGAARSAE